MRSPAGMRWAALLTALALFACGLRWYYVMTAKVVDPIRGDAIQYYSYAWNLVNHGVFSNARPGSEMVVPDSFRDPAYPAFLAGWMALTHDDQGLWYGVVLLAQAMLGGATAALAAMFSRRWLTSGAALAVGALVAIWPHGIAIVSDILTETLCGFLTVLAAWLAAIAFERRSAWRAAFAGATFSLAALTNAVLLPFAPLLALWLILRRRMPARLAAVFFVAAMALPAMWWVRGLSLPESGNSSQGRAITNFVQGSWPEYAQAWRDGIYGDGSPRTAFDREIDQAVASPAQGIAKVFQRIAADPLKYAMWYFIGKPALLWGWRMQIAQIEQRDGFYVFPTADSPYESSLPWRASASLCQSLNGWLLLAALVGLGAWLARARIGVCGEGDALGIAALLVVYVTLVYGVFQSEPRYSIPFRPFEFALAVSAVGWLWRKARSLSAESRAAAEVSADRRAS